MEVGDEVPNSTAVTIQESSNAAKSWEHSWNVDEVRKSAEQWSLAADVGLLEHMKDFACKITAQAHNVSKEVSQLLYDTRLTDARIQTVTDYFLTLSDNQFIENRVYDEDDSVEEKKDEKPPEKNVTREQREADMLPKLKEAIGFGLTVIDDAYDVLDVAVAYSDSEDDETPLPSDEVLLEPKDPYVVRPLPHLIGSRAFHEEDDAGVGDLISGDEGGSEVGSMSESDEEIEKAPTVSDVSSSEYEDTDGDSDVEDSSVDHSPITKRRATTLSSSDDYSSSDNEELFANNRNTNKMEDGLSDDGKIIQKQRAPSKRPQQEQGMFEEDDEGEDDLFAGSGGLFGKPGGLFDTPKSGLFDGVDGFSESEDEELESSSATERKQEVVVKEEAPPKKHPPGGISLFGGAIKKDFFKNPEESNSEKEDAPPSNSHPDKKSSDLFHDDSDSDDLFNEKPPPIKTGDQPSKASVEKSGGLFDESDSEEDLFNKPPPSKTSSTKERSDSRSKRPAGGVSMFGSGGGALQDALRKRRPSSSSSADHQIANSKPNWSSTQSLKSEASAGAPNPLFDGDSDDGLFGEPARAVKTPKSRVSVKTPTSKTKPKHSGSKDLFALSSGDEEDELFPQLTKTSFKPPSSHAKSTTTSKGSAKNVFADPLLDDSDAPSLTSSSNKSAVRSFQDRDVESSSNLFNVSDSDSDLFSSPPPTNQSPAIKQEEDSDDMFSNKPPSTATTKPPISSKPGPTQSSSSLFGEDHDERPIKSSLTPDKAPQKKPDKAPQKKPDKPPQKKSDKAPQKKPDKAPQKKPDKAPQKKPDKAPQKKQRGLFDDSGSDDDLFGDMAGTKPPSAPPKKHSQTDQTGSLFNEGAKKDSDNSQQAAKKSKDLFDSDSDDDLFATKPPSMKTQSRDQQDGVKESRDESVVTNPLEEDEGEKAMEPEKKRLPGAVSMFGAGGGELLASIAKRRTASQKSNISDKTSNESQVNPLEGMKDGGSDSLVDPTPVPPSTTNITAKPFRPSTVSHPVPKSSSNIDSFKAKLSINPTALLPGAAPKIVSTTDVTAPLESVTKTRSKGQAGRRPPTRKGRQRAVADAGTDFSLPSSSNISTLTPPSHPVAKQSKSNDVSAVDDLLPPESSVEVSRKKSPAPKKKTKLPSLFDDDDDVVVDSLGKKEDDLFADLTLPSKSKSERKGKPVVDVDIFANDLGFEPSSSLFDEAPSRTKSKKPKLFDDDDLFADIDDIKPSRTTKKESTKMVQNGDADIFADKSTEKKKKKKNDVASSLDTDDLFGESSSKKPSKSKDIFDDVDDLFGDVKPSKAKGKKKPAITESLFDDDDIFSTPVTKKSTSVEKKKRKEDKPEDKDPPDIFDDPLNALLGS